MIRQEVAFLHSKGIYKNEKNNSVTGYAGVFRTFRIGICSDI